VELEVCSKNETDGFNGVKTLFGEPIKDGEDLQESPTDPHSLAVLDMEVEAVKEVGWLAISLCIASRLGCTAPFSIPTFMHFFRLKLEYQQLNWNKNLPTGSARTSRILVDLAITSSTALEL
jgi:hypothetical protein